MICLFRSSGLPTFRLSVFPTFRLSGLFGLSQSKHIFPHHTFNRAGGWRVIFGVIFGIVKAFYFAFYYKIDELAYGHADVNFYRLGAGNL